MSIAPTDAGSQPPKQASNRVVDRVFDWAAIALVVVSLYLVQAWFTKENWLQYEYAMLEARALETLASGSERFEMCRADADRQAYLEVNDIVKTFRDMNVPDDGVVPSTPEFWTKLYLCPFPDVLSNKSTISTILGELRVGVSLGAYIPRADYIHRFLKSDKAHLLAGNSIQRDELASSAGEGNLKGCVAVSTEIDRPADELIPTTILKDGHIAFTTVPPSRVAMADDRVNLKPQVRWEIRIRCEGSRKRFLLSPAMFDFRDDQSGGKWAAQWIRRHLEQDSQYRHAAASMATSLREAYGTEPLPWIASQEGNLGSQTLSQAKSTLLKSREDALKAGRLLGMDGIPLRTVFAASPYVILLMLVSMLVLPLRETIAKDVVDLSFTVGISIAVAMCIVLPVAGLIALDATQGPLGIVIPTGLTSVVIGASVLGCLCVRRLWNLGRSRTVR